jgi:hypothetical protein
MIGRFSCQDSPHPHFGQRLGGLTTLRPSGRRYATTFRKLPTHAPNAKRKNAVKIRGDQIRTHVGRSAMSDSGIKKMTPCIDRCDRAGERFD